MKKYKFNNFESIINLNPDPLEISPKINIASPNIKSYKFNNIKDILLTYSKNK